MSIAFDILLGSLERCVVISHCLCFLDLLHLHLISGMREAAPFESQDICALEKQRGRFGRRDCACTKTRSVTSCGLEAQT